MTEFRHKERLPRERAAERLADIAYALTMGGTWDVRTGGEQIRVPVADDVAVLTRGSRTSGGRMLVEVRLTWSAHDGGASTPITKCG